MNYLLFVVYAWSSDKQLFCVFLLYNAFCLYMYMFVHLFVHVDMLYAQYRYSIALIYGV